MGDYCHVFDRATIQSKLNVLAGLQFCDWGGLPTLEMFGFGPWQTVTIDAGKRKGQQNRVPRYALHVQCRWQFQRAHQNAERKELAVDAVDVDDVGRVRFELDDQHTLEIIPETDPAISHEEYRLIDVVEGWHFVLTRRMDEGE
jgi:hypothetical protein